jgi:ketosteroid isomerase-like protein
MAEGDDIRRGEVGAANQEFYRAFADGDFSTMDELWSRREDVVCIHPGWPPVHGREDVMASWRGILADPPSPAIKAVDEEVYLLGEAAMVLCSETIGEIFLVATNLFVREDGNWRIIHHHAGITEHRPKTVPQPPSGTVH